MADCVGDRQIAVGDGSVVGRITTAGMITEFPLTASGELFPVLSLAVGSYKSIWFADNAHAQVGVLKLQIR